MKPCLIVLLVGLLSACTQVPINNDYDPARNFATYKTWSWLKPAVIYQPDDLRVKSDLTDQRIINAVNAQLSQRAL